MPTQARVVSCVTPTIILGGETEYIRKAKNPVLSAPKELTSQAGRQDLNKANSTRGVERRESQQSEQWHTATAVHSRKTIMSHQKKKKMYGKSSGFHHSHRAHSCWKGAEVFATGWHGRQVWLTWREAEAVSAHELRLLLAILGTLCVTLVLLRVMQIVPFIFWSSLLPSRCPKKTYGFFPPF